MATSAFISKPLGPDNWRRVIEETKSRPGVLVIADAFGGKINNVASDAMSFPHRDALYHFQIMAYFSHENGRKAAQDKVWSLYEWLMSQGLIDGSYYNYPNLNMEQVSWGKEYFKGNFERLKQLKREFDPTGVFKQMFGIPLAE